jgi:hypothetical protein
MGPETGWNRRPGKIPLNHLFRRAGMNELATTVTDWFLDEWDGSRLDDDPRDRLNEYIIDPEPLADSHFDEGGGD